MFIKLPYPYENTYLNPIFIKSFTCRRGISNGEIELNFVDGTNDRIDFFNRKEYDKFLNLLIKGE